MYFLSIPELSNAKSPKLLMQNLQISNRHNSIIFNALNNN